MVCQLICKRMEEKEPEIRWEHREIRTAMDGDEERGSDENNNVVDNNV